MKPYLNIQEAIRDFSDRIERLEAAMRVKPRKSEREEMIEIRVTKTYEVDGQELVTTFRKEFEEAESPEAFHREAIENLLGADPHHLLTLVDEDVDID